MRFLVEEQKCPRYTLQVLSDLAAARGKFEVLLYLHSISTPEEIRKWKPEKTLEKARQKESKRDENMITWLEKQIVKKQKRKIKALLTKALALAQQIS